MKAIVLTEEQVGELEVINAGITRRRVEARRLADGRLIVNADLLEDETAGAWRELLGRGVETEVGAAEMEG